MAVPSLELQIRAIHYDKANQLAFATLRLTEQGLLAGDSELYDLRIAEYGLALACDEAARENAANIVTSVDDPRAWVPVARNVFKYLRKYKQVGVHEKVLLLSDTHEQARANQATLFMDALSWQANQSAYDAYRSLLSINGKRSDQE